MAKEISNGPDLSPRESLKDQIREDLGQVKARVEDDKEKIDRLTKESKKIIANIGSWVQKGLYKDLEFVDTRSVQPTKEESNGLGTRTITQLTTVFKGAGGQPVPLIFEARVGFPRVSEVSSITVHCVLPGRPGKLDGTRWAVTNSLGARLGNHELIQENASGKVKSELRGYIDSAVTKEFSRIFNEHYRGPELDQRDRDKKNGYSFDSGIRRTGEAERGNKYMDYYKLVYSAYDELGKWPAIDKAFVQISGFSNENERRVGIQRLTLGEVFSDPELASLTYANLIGDRTVDGKRTLIYEIQERDAYPPNADLSIARYVRCTKQGSKVAVTYGTMKGRVFIEDVSKKPDWLPSGTDPAGFVPDPKLPWQNYNK